MTTKSDQYRPGAFLYCAWEEMPRFVWRIADSPVKVEKFIIRECPSDQELDRERIKIQAIDDDGNLGTTQKLMLFQLNDDGFRLSVSEAIGFLLNRLERESENASRNVARLKNNINILEEQRRALERA